MDQAKILGICNRIKASSDVRPLVIELLEEIQRDGAESKESAIANLRNMLTWPETRSNPRAMTNICRSLRRLREA